ncbi:hypothetical protein V5P93_006406 [Actinokineospora auranticolor]|uniref:Uncharacterized protein n=1 Tax=Actinokineospora auranticolor TaxID=155976 RepID=A0A2S6GFN3_9PSEU|nr:hypothetical protein [Actinokineospora auranticolor]PPK64029.1 hypothetical protein CLV40_12220 [Actinokineospora auranticolor]
MPTSIHDHIAAHLNPGGRGLLPGGEVLPDDEIDASHGGGRTRWAGVEYAGRGAAGVPELVAVAARDPSGYEPLYAALCEPDVVAQLDDVLARVRGLDLDTGVLARRLVTGARHRAPVKFGTALLGSADTELLLLVGRHEEFTRFAVAAVRATHPDPEPVLLALARGVDGWGRITAVEQFAEPAGAEVRDWLLRGGFRNSVVDNYLAFRAATVGRLADALAAQEIDPELLDGASDILCGLIEGGPAEGVDDYDDASLALWLLVGHLARHGTDLRHFVAVARVEEFLAGPGWDERYARGWDLARHDSLVRRCRDLMADPRWHGLTLRDLESPDDRAFQDASYAAARLGIDRFPATVRRLRATLADDDWFTLMSQATAERLPTILELAGSTLPLGELASGPADILAVARRWSAHVVLGTVVTGLRDFPGQGTEFVLTAVRSPVLDNRAVGVRTLTGWGPESWEPVVQAVLRVAVAEEPDPTLRERMAQLLI